MIPYSVEELDGAIKQPMDEYHRDLLRWARGRIAQEREEGRREILREIAKVQPDSSRGDMGYCNFCDADLRSRIPAMPTGNILVRVIIAIVCVILAYALIPPVSRLIGFPVDGDFLLVIKVCIAGLAVFYILRGRP